MSDLSGDSDNNSPGGGNKSHQNGTSSGSRTNPNSFIANNNKKKRRIVMRIEFDDSDGTSSDEHSDDVIRPCSSRKSGQTGGKKTYLESSSSDDASSSGSEILRSVLARRRNAKKKPIVVLSEDEKDSQSKTKIDDGFSSDSSSNELLEKCPICLLSFRDQEIGSPSICDHLFCANCIEEWSKNVQTCPIDRMEFDEINVRQSFANRELVRKIQVVKASATLAAAPEQVPEDVTHCEICRQIDREDVMLLCDNCNEGYHIDCLQPALERVPEGSWYCDNCFDSEDDMDEVDDLNVLYEDMREMGIPETRLTITELYQPRILRTRQNERIRAAILARTRPTRRVANNQVQESSVQPSTSRGVRNSEAASTSSARVSSKTPAKKRTTRKRRKRSTRQRTYVVEYDVNNFDEKFGLIKTTKKKLVRRRRKKTSRKSSKGKVKRGSGAIRMTASKRLAEQLGVKKSSFESRSGNSQLPRPSFSIFGGTNDLEYFSGDSADDGDGDLHIETGVGGTAIQTSVRISNIGSYRNRKGVVAPRISRPSGTPDILSSIIDMQDRWLNARLEDVRIAADGTLNLNAEPSQSNEKSDKSNDMENAINQAPMYPRGGRGGGGSGGGGGGYNNNRFNNQSNYNRGSGGGGSQYRHSSGGGGGGGGSTGGFNNSFGGGSTNFPFNNNSNQNNFSSYNQDRDPFERINQRHNRNQFSQNRNNNRNSAQNQPQAPSQLFSRSLQNLSNNQSSQSNNFRSFPNQNQATGSSDSIMPGMQPFLGGNIPPNPISSIPPLMPNLNPTAPVYGPENCPNSSRQDDERSATERQSTAHTSAPEGPCPRPPLAPPPWNSTLFQLTAAYANDDDDDDSNCPNFSVYSTESQQVANAIASEVDNGGAVKSGDQLNESAPKEDDENDEDLVQLGDDDEDEGEKLPNANESADEPNESSDLYQPDDPTGEDDTTSKRDESEAYNVEEAYEEDEDEEEAAKNELDNKEDDSKESVEHDTAIDDNDNAVATPIDESRRLADIQLPETETSANKKVAFKIDNRSDCRREKGVLELYDDSDWEELNIEKCSDWQQKKDEEEAQPEPTVGDEYGDDDDSELREAEAGSDDVEKASGTEVQDEPDRSYTPCLDENKEPDEEDDEGVCTPDVGPATIPSTLSLSETKHGREKRAGSDDKIETEMISEDETTQDHDRKRRDRDRDRDRRDENDRDRGDRDRRRESREQFKRVTKNQKERNYRIDRGDDKPRTSPAHRHRSRSRSNDKENFGHRQRGFTRRGGAVFGRGRRQEMQRYNVRHIIGQQRSQGDRFGRNMSRSKSRERRRRTRSRSRTESPKRRRRSFSISPSPAPFTGRRRSPADRSPTPRRSISPRSRKHSRSPRRQSPPIRRRSRSPLRMRTRSRSNSISDKAPLRRDARKQRSPSPKFGGSRSPSQGFTPRLSPSPKRRAPKRKRSKERKKKKSRKRLSTSPVAESRKKRQHSPPKQRSPSNSRSWSLSLSPAPEQNPNVGSWTPPISPPNQRIETESGEIYAEKTKPKPKDKKKRDKKKKRTEKRHDVGVRKEKRRRRISEIRAATPNVAPSKEVFASGNNILVSVSFNKEAGQPQQNTIVTMPPTREEVMSTIRRSKDRQVKKSRKSKEKPARKHKKTDAKPVAIIDLERSPFQVTQPHADIIVLTDSDCEDVAVSNAKDVNTSQLSEREHHPQENNESTPIMDRLESIPEESYELQQLGPKTPPEPPSIKFSLVTKTKQIKSRNPLHDEVEQDPSIEGESERQEIDGMQNGGGSVGGGGVGGNKIGPNTPPDDSGPCSPDVYDPFDPTKSPSISPRSPAPTSSADISQPNIENERESQKMHSSDENRASSSQDKPLNPVELVMALMSSKANLSQDVSMTSESQYNSQEIDQMHDKADESVAFQVLSNVLIAPPVKTSQHAMQTIASPVHKSSSQNLITKLPLPKLTASTSSSSRVNGGAGVGMTNNDDNTGPIDIESPYSPGSADFEDLFEPPPDSGPSGASKRPRGRKSKKTDVIESLFGSSSPAVGQPRMPSYTASMVKKPRASRQSRKNAKGGKDEEYPNSAVDLNNKDKLLRKLNRQERVVDEVKLVLKPHYNKKHITKDEYKDIMRRAVPKICHSKSGEINPKKIQNLIEAYVKKFRQKNKLNLLNTNQVSSAVKCAAYLKKL